MRRFPCPKCGHDLLEGTRACPNCELQTQEIEAPPSPGERFPEIEFATHQMAEEFAALVDASVTDTEPAPRFYSLMQFAAWGSPWLEDYLGRLEAGEAPPPPGFDPKALTLRDHLTQKERQTVRHYLPKVQAIPTNVQQAFIDCLRLRGWTPQDALSPETRQWIRTLARSGVVERDASEEERLAACSEDDLRALLERHGLEADGGRRELVGRVFDHVKASDWQAFARAKLPGRLVRCKLRIAPEFLTYLRVRRARIRLLVESVLHRERTARRAKELKATGANDEAIKAAGCSLPPFHPGCRCRVAAQQVGGQSFLVAEPTGRSCAEAEGIAKLIGEAAQRLAAERRGETALEMQVGEEHADFYANREWPWRAGMCPRCKDALYSARRGGLIFHACSECQGIWLPWRLRRELFEEHPELIGRLDTDFTYYRHDPRTGRETQRCPDCETIELEDRNYVITHNRERYETEVLTHHCPQCRGVWFDHSELHSLSKARAKLVDS